MGTVSLEGVAAAGASAPLLVFQLYVLSDRALTRSLLQRAAPHPSCSANLSPVMLLSMDFVGLPTGQLSRGRALQRRCASGLARSLWRSPLETHAPAAILWKHNDRRPGRAQAPSARATGR